MAESSGQIPSLNLDSLSEGLRNFAPSVDAGTPPTTPDPEIETTTPDEAAVTPEINAEEQDSDTETPFTHTLRAEYLPDVEDDFPADYEGVSKLVKTVADTHKAQGRTEVVEEMFGNFPELDEYLNYRMNGGNPQDYFKVLSEGKDATYNLDNVEDQKAIIKDFLSSTLDEEDIEATLITMEETGKLKSNAEKYHAKKEAGKAGKLEALAATQAQQAEAQRKADSDYWTGIKTTIDSGKLANNTVIPQPDRKAFFEWLAVPKASGKPQQALDWETFTPEEKLAFQYFIYKKGDVKALANRSVETTKVNKQVSLIKPGSRMSGGKEDKSPAKIALIGGMKGVSFQ